MFLLVLKSVNNATSLLNQPAVFETTAHQINLQSKFVLPNHRDLYVPNVRKTRYVRHFRDDQNSRILYLCQRFLKTVGDRFCKCQPVVHYYSLNCCFLCFCLLMKYFEWYLSSIFGKYTSVLNQISWTSYFSDMA